MRLLYPVLLPGNLRMCLTAPICGKSQNWRPGDHFREDTLKNGVPERETADAYYYHSGNK